MKHGQPEEHWFFESQDPSHFQDIPQLDSLRHSVDKLHMLGLVLTSLCMKYLQVLISHEFRNHGRSHRPGTKGWHGRFGRLTIHLCKVPKIVHLKIQLKMP